VNRSRGSRAGPNIERLGFNLSMHAELWAETVGPFTSSNGVVAASITAIPCTTAAEPLLRQPPKRQNRNRSRKRKDKSQSRVPVTALIAWPTFHSEVKQQVD